MSYIKLTRIRLFNEFSSFLNKNLNYESVNNEMLIDSKVWVLGTHSKNHCLMLLLSTGTYININLTNTMTAHNNVYIYNKYWKMLCLILKQNVYIVYTMNTYTNVYLL